MKKTPDGKLRELQNEDQGQKNKSRQTEDKVERRHTDAWKNAVDCRMLHNILAKSTSRNESNTIAGKL